MSMLEIRGCHHVFGIEHLLGELGDSNSTVLFVSTGSERRKTVMMKCRGGKGTN